MSHTTATTIVTEGVSSDVTSSWRSCGSVVVRRRRGGVSLLLMRHSKVRLRLGVQLLLRTGKASPGQRPMRRPEGLAC